MPSSLSARPIPRVPQLRSRPLTVRSGFRATVTAVLPAGIATAAALLPLLLAACTTQVVLQRRAMLDCPEPVVVCRPGRFDQVLVDTASDQPVYLRISRVRNLDRDVDEFGVVFPTGPGAGDDAFATVRSATIDAIVTVSFDAPDEAEPGVRLEDRNEASSVGGGARYGRSDSIYFTARRAGSLRGDYDLFTGLAETEGIVDPRRLPPSTRRFWDAQAALAPDGRTLYFASDRPGGLGGVDLYVSRLDARGSWGEPENLGPAVNTPCDELTPFVSGDGRWLYFSSSGHETVGGYDLFRAPVSRGEVGRAENLGRPINTEADEIFPGAPAAAAPDTLLYYGSNQAGSQRFDVYVLYRVRSRRASRVAIRQPEPIELRGTVFDPLGRPVDSALVRIEQRDPPGPIDSMTTDTSGRYGFRITEGRRYELSAGSGRTLYGKEEVYVPPSNREPSIVRDIHLPDTVTFRINFPFNNSTDPYEFTLDEQGLPTGERWTEVMDRTAEFLRRLNPAESRVLIIGHTDPVGSDAFNLGLGSRRAEFVRRALIARGVAPGLLVTESRGESMPLPPSGSSDETLDRYHARLRRVELVRRDVTRP